MRNHTDCYFCFNCHALGHWNRRDGIGICWQPYKGPLVRIAPIEVVPGNADTLRRIIAANPPFVNKSPWFAMARTLPSRGGIISMVDKEGHKVIKRSWH